MGAEEQIQMQLVELEGIKLDHSKIISYLHTPTVLVLADYMFTTQCITICLIALLLLLQTTYQQNLDLETWLYNTVLNFEVNYEKSL